MSISSQRIILGMVAILENSDTKHFQSSRSILYHSIIVICPLLVIYYLAICLHAHAVTLPSDGLDANDSTDLGIVPGTRRGNHVHALDVCGLQLF